MRELNLLAALALLLAACSGGATAPSREAPGLAAAYVLANPAGLLALDGNAKTIGRIVDLPANSAPATPSLHPGGKAVLFALTLVPTKPSGFGSDIFIVNLDGSGLRSILDHEADAVFYASPRLDPSGNVLYVHRRAALVRSGSYVGNEDAILRVDLRTGERKTLLRDGADPTLSPDGRTILYVHMKDGAGDGLWIADADGANARPFLRSRDTFWYQQAPRYSPDGTMVAFSAAGHAASAAPRRGAGSGKRAHLGVPSELFVNAADGTGLRSVGQTGDDVTPAWSPDGARIAYVGTGGFYVLTLATGNIRTVAQSADFFFGDLLWLR